MKNYFKMFSMLAIASILVLASCEKKSDEAKTTQDYLTAGNWKITGMTINPGVEIAGITITDIYNIFVEDCSKDDLIKFNNDGTITEDEGTIKCNPENPQTTHDGTWTLSNDDEIITIKYYGEVSAPATIVSINSSTFVVSSTLDLDLGIGITAQTATITMTRQ